MIDINSKVLAVLQASSCFGIAYDDTVAECKKCDVNSQCKVKSSGFPLDNTTTKVMDKALEPVRKEESKKKASVSKPKKATTTKAKPASTPTVKISGEMPDFKAMNLEELKSLAGKYSVDWKDYGNDNITRMRLIMELKKCYK